jgi:ADP-ribosyl-[dinitrogen reductase] hydrolase
MIDPEAPVGPTLIDDCGLYAANLAGAQRASREMAVVSLCRVDTLDSPHAAHREVFLIDGDTDDNPSLDHAVDQAVRAIDAFIDEGLDVVVHCHGGRSRTALVLKAWYMRRHGVDHTAAHRWMTDVWPLYSTWNTSFTEFLDHDWSAR